MRMLLLCLTLALSASPLSAQDTLGLSAPDAVRDSGLLKHLLPRFSLKTGVRVIDDASGAMILAPDPPGVPVFLGNGIIYHLRIGDDPRAAQFRDWLTSDIGKRTVESFQPDGTALYSASIDVAKVVTAPEISGDAALGAVLSLKHCGRCHVVGTVNQMNGIGSTPSFAVLRSLPDWNNRFEQFFVLRPHGAFTQIADVTEPFDPERPSPIVPLHMTLDDLDAILAYVAAIAAADLGAPLQTQ
ncbi:hypothetical protein ACXYMO_04165 [Arenibacterium sp. CAU 1754]